MSLPAGMTVKPLYDKCPRCGCDLQKFYQSEQDESESGNIKQNADASGFSSMSADFPVRPVEIIEHERFLVGMVDPFANSPEEKTGRDKGRWFGRVGRQQSGSVDEKYECTSCDKDFVPRIKGKFRQRIFHFLFRLLGGRYE